MIWAVTVVPMFAPMMMPMACFRVISPALTKLTVITVVPLLLWMRTVTRLPTKTPRSGVFVNVPIRWRIRSPAMNCRASLISLIP